MSHYAILAPAFTGHLNPLGVLARALARRGHRVTVLSPLDAAAKVERAGLAFIPIAATEFPAGEWHRLAARAGNATGLKATAAAGRMIALLTRGVLRDLPEIARREQFDGLVMDQIAVGTESVCEVLGLPLAVACCALAMHIESGVPPPYFPWRCRPGPHFRLRNTFAQFAVNLTGLPVLRELGPYRFKHRLPPMGFRYINELRPSLVQVAQQPAFFDFPRRHLPDHVHCTGPWLDDFAGDSPAFPWERLDGRPLIYATMGTIQNQLASAFRIMLEACAGLDAQLVFALGRTEPTVSAPAQGNAVFVDYAPQRAVLARAALVICHGGLNTTLEALSAGVPVIALPISNDQPGNAVRIEHFGLGVCLPFRQLTAPALRRAVQQVLGTPAFGERTRRVATELRGLPGPAIAAGLIETAFISRQRVRR